MTPYRLASLLWPTLLGLSLALTVGSASAEEVRFAAVLPNGHLYQTKVESMDAARYRDIVRQHTDYSCGAAALATLLRYAYGLKVNEALVLAGLMGVSNPAVVRKRGFSLLDIKHYVEAIGLRGRGYRITEARLRDVRIPTIVLIDTKGYHHFVVLKQIKDNVAEIADPVLGNMHLPLAQFMRMWPSHAVFAVIGSGFERNTVLRRTQPAADAHALYERAGPITNRELMEFGFTRADLF